MFFDKLCQSLFGHSLPRAASAPAPVAAGGAHRLSAIVRESAPSGLIEINVARFSRESAADVG